MRKIIKKWLITAVILIVLGIILFVGAVAAFGFDFTKLSTETYETNTHEISKTFDKISIDTDTTEIAFVPSEDKRCKIICVESDKVKHSAMVQNGTLVIKAVNTRKWYEYFGIFLETPKITIYLPQQNYHSLFIDTDTSDSITIPECFTFENIDIKCDTSDVECLASVSKVIHMESDTGTIKVESVNTEEIVLSTDTGDIHINSVIAKGNITIETDTGAIKVSDVTCTNLTAKSDTNTVLLKNIVAKDNFFIENDTGNVRLENSDAAQIFVKTNTGDVMGSLRSPKIFLTETDTGSVNVPKSTEGGKCEISTDTGNIMIEIQ